MLKEEAEQTLNQGLSRLFSCSMANASSILSSVHIPSFSHGAETVVLRTPREKEKTLADMGMPDKEKEPDEPTPFSNTNVQNLCIAQK